MKPRHCLVPLLLFLSIICKGQIRENPDVKTRAPGMHFILIDTYDARILEEKKPWKYKSVYALDSVTIVLKSKKVEETFCTGEGNQWGTTTDFKSGKLQITAFRAGYDTLSTVWKMTDTCQQLEVFLKKKEE